MSAKLIEFRGRSLASQPEVSQETLQKLFDDQESAWLAFCQAHAEALAIQDLVRIGARIEAGRITFDVEACKARLVEEPAARGGNAREPRQHKS